MKILEPSKRFCGNWADRLEGLFDIGVDYTGQRILDVGSNMGIVSYEISKLKPASIHGIERHWLHVQVAREIFNAVPVEARFDWASAGGPRFLSKLHDEYDIVLMLAVYYHIGRKKGPKRANEALRMILARCKSTIVFAENPGRAFDDFANTAVEFGFQPGRHYHRVAGGRSRCSPVINSSPSQPTAN